MCGQSMRDIAKTFKVSHTAVRNVMRQAGFTPSYSIGMPYREPVAGLIAKLEKTESWHEYKWRACCPQSSHFNEAKPLATAERQPGNGSGARNGEPSATDAPEKLTLPESRDEVILSDE